jgi:hypothetical protein
MPRSRPRFGRLMDKAVSVLASGGDPSASTDSEVKHFWNWRKDPSGEKHKLPAASTRTGKARKTVMIGLFNLEVHNV